MIGAFLMLAQIERAPEEAKPVVTTIAAVRANPKKFDGRVIRLHGYVNRCISSDCSIQERPLDDKGGPGDSLSIAVNPQFDATIKPLLPTYVEFDARVDATCLVGVCLDRAPVLSVTTLRGVVSPEPPAFEN